MLNFVLGTVFGAVVMLFTLGIFNASHDQRLIQEVLHSCQDTRSEEPPNAN